MAIWDRKAAPAAAVAIIRATEGLHLTPYDDNGSRPGGTWTIGIGATRDLAGQPVTPRTPPITQEQAEQLLRRDMGFAVRAVARTFSVELTEDQAGALISLAFNLGSFAEAETMVSLVQTGQWQLAAQQFRAYRNQEGRPVLGLRRRRWVEASVFLNGADAIAAWEEAQQRIRTVDDWPPLAGGGGAPAPVPPRPAAPAAARPVPLSEADQLNQRELDRIRGGRSHG